mmetsp:Transcript_39731/g.93049  ORF Transcript_39731/g.93049 Transcript_39731/m.93049 type:complete len:217 (-) Transcript_39731:67-717(-)
MKATLKWREEIGIDAMRRCTDATDSDSETVRAMRDVLSVDMASGKVFVKGYDKEGRALYTVTPSKKNSDDEAAIVKSHIYALERCIACTERNTDGKEERITCIFDFSHFSRKHSYPLKIIGKVFGVLKAHYPERIHKMYFLDAPVVFRGVWTCIKPFVDPVTGSKIRFVQGKRAKDKYFGNAIDADQATPNIRTDGTLSPGFDANAFLNTPFHEAY